MKKRSLIAILLAVVAAAGLLTAHASPEKKYTVTYYDFFDTVTQLTIYTDSDEKFDYFCTAAREELNRLHKIFDNFHSYTGVDNLYHLNHSDRTRPVHCERELYELLKWARNQQPLTNNKFNYAMGGVLSLWHEAREKGDVLPDITLLKDAQKHMSTNSLIFNDEDRTVFFSDPLVTLDLGGIAKGYAVEFVSRKLSEAGCSSFLLNAGGNVKAVGAPMDGRSAWNVGVANPDQPQECVLVLHVRDTSVVTSGDYQRFYQVGSIKYHHLIDPDTLFPSGYFRSVTVVTPDSCLADFLSTALFLLPYEQGKQLLIHFPQAECLWIFPDHGRKMTEGMNKYIQ